MKRFLLEKFIPFLFYFSSFLLAAKLVLLAWMVNVGLGFLIGVLIFSLTIGILSKNDRSRRA